MACGASSGVSRLLGPAAAHRALLLAHRRPRPTPPLPIQPPGPPPGAGGQRGQRLGSTRGSASASGSLLRGWDAPSSLRGARAPGPRRAGSRAQPAAPPPRPPARPGTASGAPRAARSRCECARPTCRSGRRRGPREPREGQRGPEGGGRQSRAIAGPRCGPRGTVGRRAVVQGGLGACGAAAACTGRCSRSRACCRGPWGRAWSWRPPSAPASPSAVLAAPHPTLLAHTSPHVNTRAGTRALNHTHTPSGCDLSRDALSRPEFTLGLNKTLRSRQAVLRATHYAELPTKLLYTQSWNQKTLAIEDLVALVSPGPIPF